MHPGGTLNSGPFGFSIHTATLPPPSGVHGPATAQRCGRWVGAEHPSHTSGPWPEEDQRTRGGGASLQIGVMVGTDITPHSPRTTTSFTRKLTLPLLTLESLTTLLFFLFAVVGEHANSLVLGPPDSVTLLTLFLIYYSFPLPPSPSELHHPFLVAVASQPFLCTTSRNQPS